MWIHIFTQMLAYGIIFPIGMVLGVSDPVSQSHASRDKETDNTLDR